MNKSRVYFNLWGFLYKNETSFLVKSTKNQLLFLRHALFCRAYIDITGEGPTEGLDSQVLQAFYNTWEELEAEEWYPKSQHSKQGAINPNGQETRHEPCSGNSHRAAGRHSPFHPRGFEGTPGHSQGVRGGGGDGDHRLHGPEPFLLLCLLSGFAAMSAPYFLYSLLGTRGTKYCFPLSRSPLHLMIVFTSPLFLLLCRLKNWNSSKPPFYIVFQTFDLLLFLLLLTTENWTFINGN